MGAPTAYIGYGSEEEEEEEEVLSQSIFKSRLFHGIFEITGCLVRYRLTLLRHDTSVSQIMN